MSETERRAREDEESRAAGAAGEAEGESSGDDDGDDDDVMTGDVRTTESGVTELRSLCMNCHGTAMTRMMMVTIPYFREIIVMSSSCPSCGYRTTEAQPAGEIQPEGVRYTLTVTAPEDMNRQIIKQESATFRIPEIDFEIPPNSQKGQLNTLEGILDNAYDGLRAGQEQRRKINPEAAEALDRFIARLDAMKRGEELPFTVALEDPSGNSFVQNPHAPKADPHLRTEHFRRSAQQNIDLGLYSSEQLEGAAAERRRLEGVAEGSSEGESSDEEEEDGGGGGGRGDGGGDGGGDDDKGAAAGAADAGAADAGAEDAVAEDAGAEDAGGPAAVGGKPGGLISGKEQRRALRLLFDSSSKPDVAKEVMQFPVTCHACGSRGSENMCVTDIPYFKEIIIMAFLCDKCGFRNNEIRTGGAVSEKGRRITLHVTPASFEEDVRRDLLKSDTAGLRVRGARPWLGTPRPAPTHPHGAQIPEIDLDIEQGSLGSMYTTVEGMLSKIREKLLEGHPFFLGDSAEEGNKFAQFIAALDRVLKGDMAFDLIVEDPLANSWVYSSYAPAPDPRMTVEDYERSEDENETLGLLDMKVEGYEASAAGQPSGSAADGDHEA